MCICGCDVVAPLRRRRRANEPLAAFLARFDRQFTPAERQRIRSAGGDAEQEAEFRYDSKCGSLAWVAADAEFLVMYALPALGIAGLFIHASCRSVLLSPAPHPSHALPPACSKLWALKEAYVKATGEGLGFDLGKVEFSISGNTGAFVLW